MKKQSKSKLSSLPKTMVGWREWVSLPELNIKRIKAKVDSGARTSALHAFALRPFKQDNKHYIRFKIHPMQRKTDETVDCLAEVQDIRWVTDSGGHRERRYVITTMLTVGAETWPIEITLTNRDTMNFRMLLGRTAMKHRIIVNPALSFLVSAVPGEQPRWGVGRGENRGSTSSRSSHS